jgi:hypothetical protein
MATKVYVYHSLFCGRICQTPYKIWRRRSLHFVWMDQKHSKLFRFRIHHFSGKMHRFFCYFFVYRSMPLFIIYKFPTKWNFVLCPYCSVAIWSCEQGSVKSLALFIALRMVCGCSGLLDVIKWTNIYNPFLSRNSFDSIIVDCDLFLLHFS